MAKQIYFYIDDSGVFTHHKNQIFFTYAGFCVIGRHERERVLARYREVNQKIRKEYAFHGEIKAAHIDQSLKDRLFDTIRHLESFDITVNLHQLDYDILRDKRTKVRYKDFLLRTVIVGKLEQMLAKGLIIHNEHVEIYLNIDEQYALSNYSIKDGIYERLCYGYQHFDYSVKFKPVLKVVDHISQEFKHSDHDFLIQAADILANRIYTSHVYDRPCWREIENHLSFFLPVSLADDAVPMAKGLQVPFTDDEMEDVEEELWP